MAALFNRWLLLLLFPGSWLSMGKFLPQQVQSGAQPSVLLHPFHGSVIEINENTSEKTLEIGCKIYTDDFEKVLAKNYNKKVDLINPPNKPAMDSLIKKYMFSHMAIQANGKPVALSYIGFENENEAAYVYIQASNVITLNKLELATNLMYDLFDDQVNIIHLTIDGTNRKSNKLNFPATSTEFIY